MNDDGNLSPRERIEKRRRENDLRMVRLAINPPHFQRVGEMAARFSLEPGSVPQSTTYDRSVIEIRPGLVPYASRFPDRGFRRCRKRGAFYVTRLRYLRWMGE